MAKTKKVAKPVTEEKNKHDGLQKFNLDDQNTLRHKLDESVAEVVTQSGYKENATVIYVKITLGLASVLLAVYAQFGPGKFPNNWWSTFACIVGYIVCTVLLNIYCFLVEKDAFLICHPRKEFGEDIPLYAMSHMERYSDVYHVEFCSSLAPSARGQSELKTSITKYFHSDGYFAEDSFKDDVLQLLEKYLAKQKAGSSKKQQ